MGFFSSLADNRRFKQLPAEQRNLVFYSESGQDWHHFESIVGNLLQQGRNVCYISSDGDDPGVNSNHPKLHTFVIDSDPIRIWLFQMMKADVCVLTMMDLENLQLKRSINQVHYVYLFHGLGSTHMADHANSYDAYDSLMCAGPHHVAELRKREQLANLAPRELIEHGYERLERLHKDVSKKPDPNSQPHVLVAPTWGKNSLLNLCAEPLIEQLLAADMRVTLRPHYHSKVIDHELVDALFKKFQGRAGFNSVESMSESDSLISSHVLVCDWSGMAIEYGLALEKPVVFIDVPRRIRNPDWQDWGMQPLEASIRQQLGEVIAPEQLESTPKVIRRLIDSPKPAADYDALRREVVFNFGTSAAVGAAELAKIADRQRGIGMRARLK